MEKEKIKWEELENKVANKENEFIEKEDNIEQEDTENIKNNRKKIIIPIVIITIIFLLLLIFSTIFAIINIKNNNIVSGVKIQGIDVSGLSRDDAKSKIELLYNEKKQKDILVKYNEYEAVVNPELIEVNYNIEEAVEKAISIGKDSNIIKNNYNILFALMGKNNIEVNMTLNEELTNKTIGDIQANLPNAVINPEYYIEKDKLIISKGKQGVEIDSEKLIKKIKENLKSTNINQEYIELPIINKEPDKINIEKIYEEVHKEVKDAYFTKEPFTIHPEVEGVNFNLEEAKKILEEDKEKYEIQLIITKPKVTTSQIGSEAFPNLLATYSTRYDGGDVDRTANLRIACQKINGKVVLPGEIFSYNKALGPRTAAAGYKNAKIYENGKVVDGIGGGICQISSTLYNAVLMSNMVATERTNHMFKTSYTPAGRDATVVYGAIDFKFKNTRTYAIKIQASCSNGVATVSIYGIKEENEYQVSFSTKTISTIPFSVKYEDNNKLPVGQEEVIQKGANGFVTETYIIKSLNGKVVSSKLLSKDTYSAMQKIISRGTKPVIVETNTNPSTNVNTNTNTETNNNSGSNDNSGNNKPDTSEKPEINDETNNKPNDIPTVTPPVTDGNGEEKPGEETSPVDNSIVL